MTVLFKPENGTFPAVEYRATSLKGQRHILIVDDEPNYRFAAGVALRRAGYRITEAENGEIALLLILDREKSESFDLMLVDLRMPGMSGIEFIEEVKRRNMPVPIVVVSAYVDKSVQDELKGKGYFDFLHKPFEPDELVEKVWTALDGKRDHGERSCLT